MQIFDGTHAQQLVEWMFDDQPAEVIRSIYESIEDLLEEVGGPSSFVGAKVPVTPEIDVVAYVMLYPGSLAVLTGPKCISKTSVSDFDMCIPIATEVCTALSQIARDRWPIEILQVTIPDDADFQSQVLRNAGYQNLATLNQITLRSINFPAGLDSELQSENKWKRFERDDWERFRHWMESSYEQTLDCPEMASIRTTNNVIEGYWQIATGSTSRRAVDSDTDLPQWWLRADEPNTSDPIQAAFLLTPINRGIWELTYIGVGLPYRRQGLGTESLNLAIAKLRELKADQIITYVDSRNTPALELYERAGFRPCGRWVAYHWPLAKRDGGAGSNS